MPALKPGHIGVMDNLQQSQVGNNRAIYQSGGRARLWFLSPYSPELNPIEQAFSKIKHWVRDAQKCTIDDRWRHVGRLVEIIQPADCASYLENAGYVSVNRCDALGPIRVTLTCKSRTGIREAGFRRRETPEGN